MKESRLLTEYKKALKAFEDARNAAYEEMERMMAPGMSTGGCGFWLDQVMEASDRVTELSQKLRCAGYQMA